MVLAYTDTRDSTGPLHVLSGSGDAIVIKLNRMVDVFEGIDYH